MKNVLIYRLQMFKNSEPFIQLQTRYLTRYRPIFAGKNLFGDPLAEDFINLESAGKADRFRHTILRDPQPLASLLRGRKISVIHAHFGIDGVYAARLAHLLNVPLIVTLHGFDVTVKFRSFLRSGSPSLINYVINFQDLGNRASKIICVSNFIEQRALQCRLPRAKLQTHYIGIDTHQFTPVTSSQEERGKVLHVARLVEKKGTRYLIEAVAILKDHHKINIGVDIVGDGPERENLVALANALGVEAQVKFHGQVSQVEVKAFLNQAACLCLPSVTARNGDAEGLGMVILEAAATGIPVVATRHGGIPEAVIDQETGILVDERSAEQLALALARLTSSREIWRQMSARSRRMVEDRFDVRRQTESLQEVYDEAIRGHGKA